MSTRIRIDDDLMEGVREAATAAGCDETWFVHHAIRHALKTRMVPPRQPGFDPAAAAAEREVRRASRPEALSFDSSTQEPARGGRRT